ncbi:nuclear transport factor 2 family protein [Nocardia stercoris]|uniref:Nuclear transport factor 2 family protein n=1 Tax=Nocardia stercoris TaxID=2483361 RepID=A0A3M2L432_9NOCA|nr:nuclear transport factor 2 family protein [Nocardia stercoris]RMI31470.1 nuclear transport factor 2 family protein [Nocardia stercoris]
MFTEDAHWVYPQAGDDVVGRAAIVARVGSGIDRLDATQHLLGNHVVAVDGELARHVCYFHAQHVWRGLPDGELFLSGTRTPSSSVDAW